MDHESWRLVNDELVDTGYSMTTDNWTGMTEKLNKFWNEYVERTIESIRVQLVTAVLTDLVKSAERTLYQKKQNNDSSQWIVAE